MTELHLTDEQLASLADNSLEGADRGLLLEHLRACPTCRETFRDTIRYRAMLLADASLFRAPDDAVRDARRIGEGNRRREPRVLPGIRWLLTPGALAGLTAAAMVVTAIALWQSGYGPHRPDYARLFQPLQQATASASSEGSIVLPGAEDVAATASPLYRSGHVEPSEAIDSALDELMRAYRNRPNQEIAHWLITGCLATGDVERAAIYARDARLRFPDESRFVVLDAIVAYRSNEMDRAEHLLQSALENDPDNGAAMLNLALVQYEMGQADSARRTLEMVRAHFPGSALDARATALIADLLNG
ncbi:MAG TPA: tetratricopeptide repeat protein [Candidatus Krumholzibacteria bacterium]|nr:tetratricopeptide repeat protein [Candidatus Krumholzibacteria bacterium]